MSTPASILVTLLIIALPIGAACDRSPVSDRRAPVTAPAEWAAQHGRQTGAPAEGGRPTDPRNDMSRMATSHPTDQHRFLVISGVIVVAIGAIIAVTVWRLEVRRRREDREERDAAA